MLTKSTITYYFPTQNNMSVSSYVNALSSSDLTLAKLQQTYNEYGIANGSPLIRELTQVCIQMLKNKDHLTQDQVKKICKKYLDLKVISSIPHVPPKIDDKPYREYRINPDTGILFKEDDKYGLVAKAVMISDNIYPLQYRHINICISNGWYFSVDNDNISCPFKV